MSKVYFFSYKKRSTPLIGIEQLINKSGFIDMIPENGDVALKLHMGELGNIRYIRPVLVRTVVDIVKSKGSRPFLTDTVVNYPSQRDLKEKYLCTAAMNGFSEFTTNCPVIITDDSDKLLTIPIKKHINGCKLIEIRVPMRLIETDCLIVLSHFKGHDLTGFGGALKNIAMGCVSTETKRAQHSVNMPEYQNDRECNGCGTCVELCPSHAIKLSDGKPFRTDAECISCATCYFVCPSHCWEWPVGSKELLQIYMAHVTYTLLNEYKGKTVYINFIQDVVPHCDCAAPSGIPVVQDVGIVLSMDPVAVDKASFDLVDQSPIIPESTRVNPPDILGKIHNTNSQVQLKTAQRLGLGSIKYDLITV